MVALPSGLTGRVLLLLAGALVVAGYSYHLGGKHADQRHKSELADHLLRAQEEARAIALQDAEFTDQGETLRERIRTVYRDIEREVVKNVEADCFQCGLTPDGFRLFNDALTGAASRADPGKQADPVPGPTPDNQPPVPGPSPVVDSRFRKVL